MNPAALVGIVLLIGNLVLGALWMSERAISAEARTQIAEGRADQAEAVATAHRESGREITRLTVANQEVQRDLLTAQKQITAAAGDRAAGERLREQERADIADAASRATAGACGRYADAAERDLGRVEADATTMGLRAASASAAAHALERTLAARRAALAEKRAALKPPTKD